VEQSDPVERRSDLDPHSVIAMPPANATDNRTTISICGGHRTRSPMKRLFGCPPYRPGCDGGANCDHNIVGHPTRSAGRAPDQSSALPTATEPWNAVANAAGAYAASAAPRCARSAAATAPSARAPTSAKLVICTRTSSGRTIQIDPPAVAARKKHVAPETRQMLMITGRRP
jgi:hypothetical protein